MDRKKLVPILAMMVVGFSVSCASAKDDEPRYKMSPMDGGFVRLDTQTGAMAFCTRSDGKWSCKPMPESSGANSDEAARLRAENSNLKDELQRMEETLGREPRGSRDGLGNEGDNIGEPEDKAGRQPEIRLPDEEQVDQAIDYLERMIRKFRKRFERFGERIEPRGGDKDDGRNEDRERDPDPQDDGSSGKPRQL